MCNGDVDSTESNVITEEHNSPESTKPTEETTASVESNKQSESTETTASKANQSSNDERLRPLVISGPMGSGKTTVIKKLKRDYRHCFVESVSHTTRLPRKGEEDGTAYHFVSEEKFESMVSSGEFFENVDINHHRYGTSKAAMKVACSQPGLIGLFDVDITAKKKIQQGHLNPAPLFICIIPPSLEVLKKRLTERGTESEEDVQDRLKTAPEAMEHAREEGAYDFVIVNGECLDVTYSKIRQFLENNYPHLINV